jgi:hypothetical protein
MKVKSHVNYTSFGDCEAAVRKRHIRRIDKFGKPIGTRSFPVHQRIESEFKDCAKDLALARCQTSIERGKSFTN